MGSLNEGSKKVVYVLLMVVFGVVGVEMWKFDKKVEVEIKKIREERNK